MDRSVSTLSISIYVSTLDISTLVCTHIQTTPIQNTVDMLYRVDLETLNTLCKRNPVVEVSLAEYRLFYRALWYKTVGMLYVLGRSGNSESWVDRSTE